FAHSYLVVRTYTSSIFVHFTSPPETHPLSLHDALPIFGGPRKMGSRGKRHGGRGGADAPADCAYPWCLFGYFLGIQKVTRPAGRSEEHTSELQSRFDLVCRLLLEKKKRNQ